MAYQLNRTGYVQMVKAFAVPPSIDPAIKGASLTDLTMAFAQAWDGPAMRRYADALSAASLEHLERARPQIFFCAKNVLQRLDDESHAVTRSVKHIASP